MKSLILLLEVGSREPVLAAARTFWKVRSDPRFGTVVKVARAAIL